MKNTIIFLVLALCLTSCATYHHRTTTFDKSYEYDSLFSAALVSLNNNNYSIVDHNVTDGVIRATNLSKLYTVNSIGVFGIIPWFYSELSFPTMTIILAKSKDGIMMNVSEATSTSLSDMTNALIDSTKMTYVTLSGKRAFQEQSNKTASSLGAELTQLKVVFNWKDSDREPELEIINKENSSLESVKVSVIYFGETTMLFSAAVKDIDKKQTVKASDFLDANKNKLWLKSQPDEIELRCKVNGKEGYIIWKP